MRCKLCDRWWARLWEKTDAWERAHSNESELWSEEPIRNHELIEQAYAARKADPAAAFRLYLEAAEAGSTFAMEAVAFHFETGAGAADDLAKAGEYYRRAISAGSWTSTIHYARFLAEQGCRDDCESILEDGVASDFAPAYFWLAYLRYKRCKSRDGFREIRPLLEYAAGKGHPAAQIYLARFMILGKFGLCEIPRGITMAVRLASSAEEDVGDQDAAVQALARE